MSSLTTPPVGTTTTPAVTNHNSTATPNAIPERGSCFADLIKTVESIMSNVFHCVTLGYFKADPKEETLAIARVLAKIGQLSNFDPAYDSKFLEIYREASSQIRSDILAKNDETRSFSKMATALGTELTRYQAHDLRQLRQNVIARQQFNYPLQAAPSATEQFKRLASSNLSVDVVTKIHQDFATQLYYTWTNNQSPAVRDEMISLTKAYWDHRAARAN